MYVLFYTATHTKEEVAQRWKEFYEEYNTHETENFKWEEIKEEIEHDLETDEVLYYGFYVCDDCGKVLLFAKDTNWTGIVGIDNDWEIDDCNHKSYCRSCYDNNDYVRCYECGEILNINDTIEPFDREGRLYCQQCADRYLYVCRDCGIYFYNTTTINISFDNNCELCRDCLQREIEQGDSFRCDDCGCYYTQDHLHELNSGYYCDDCAEEHEEQSNHCHEYSYKPNSIFYEFDNNNNTIVVSKIYPDKQTLYMGIELETVCEYYTEDYIDDLHELNYVYCKNDGSLPDYTGVEVVTHPCTLDFYENEAIPEIIEITSNYKAISHNDGSCGLHIHCSRDFFGKNDMEKDYNALKLILFMDKEWESFLKFSRRKFLNYCEKYDSFYRENELDENPEVLKIKNKEKFKKDIVTAKNHGGLYNNDRYKAINLQNSNTIEFRLWRGSTKKNTVLATIEFTYGLCNVIKTLNVNELLDTTFNDMVDKIRVLFKKEGRSFEHIDQYLKERGM